MITTKQRKTLSSMAQTLTPSFIIGVGGLTDNSIRELSNLLEARELVKITILKTSGLVPREFIDSLCKTLAAEPVSCLGQKIVIYRRSEKKGIKHIEF
ncbi:MAG: YhbY family RNA-binding protein [Clostridia bacterium]|nr:YhbY family RNA-binding protein [Clostridia bacterium]